MGIVLITMPGASKIDFANKLQEKTGAVDCVIVQRERLAPRRDFLERVKKMANQGILTDELWPALMLRLSPKARRTLTYFRASSNSKKNLRNPSLKIIEVESINSDTSYEILKAFSPELLVIWGSKVLEPRIINTAKQAINLHIGHCPHYRGTLANQYAVLNNDFTCIGATIHHVSKEVDGGNILATIEADLSKEPQELFVDLNDRAQALCVDIAAKLYKGVHIPAKKQDLHQGKNLTLADWTPRVRYSVAKKMLKWEKDIKTKKGKPKQ